MFLLHLSLSHVQEGCLLYVILHSVEIYSPLFSTFFLVVHHLGSLVLYVKILHEVALVLNMALADQGSEDTCGAET